ncbi:MULTISPECIES: OmpA family protein [Rhodobacterales]|uniref:OmpA/MotB family protein n=1 Tax=Rhodobacterales TaxID=204455 RepID=UPI001107F2FB|nr:MULTISPECIES: OmpA family protein [Rhodobacterales]
MRGQLRRRLQDEDEESAFVSMTDMTVGFLFIIMILLAFFVSQALDQTETVPLETHERVVRDRDVAFKRVAVLEVLLAQLQLQLQQTENDLEQARTSLQAAKVRIEELEKQIRELKAELAELRKVDPLEAYLSRVTQTRREVLVRLRDAIRKDFPDLQVELSEESDALRFQGEGLFASGRSNLTPAKEDIVARLAQRLDEVLPCFTLGPRSKFAEDCNPGFVMIEAVQIEGHTDNVGTDRLNRNLSTARANSTFFAMTGAAPLLMEQLNLKLQPVLSVAAYGPDRPVAANGTEEGRATNRRIDLRFIMVTPQDTDGIAAIRAALETSLGTAE